MIESNSRVPDSVECVVALVDDDPMWRYLLVSELGERGLRVLDYPSPEDYLACPEGAAAALVIVDALMPGTDGFELCRRIRGRPGGATVPLLMLTSLDDDGSITRAYAAGATDFFIKSTHWTLLLERVRRMILDARALAHALAGTAGAAAPQPLDPLTGLPGRSALLAHLERRIASSASPDAPITVVKVDVDRFDQVNATLGQAAGDELLTQIGKRLGALGADLVARLPGDEFALIFCGGRDETAVREQIAGVVRAFRDPFGLGGIEYFASSSVGIASYPSDTTDAGSLLSCARSAVARAKEAGRNRVEHYVRRRQDGARRILLQNALHRALERDEITLHYQPVVDLRTESVCSVEALMRWRREGEWVSPAEFIPIAEDTGLIQTLGDWAVRRALRQLSEWRGAGLAIGAVAVNVPASHMGNASLVAVVREAIEQAGVCGDALILELTESGAMRDVEVTLAQLDRFHALGVRLAIDDFGTGHSSLARLTRLPIDTLKIDRSFVSRMHESDEDASVVRAIVALAASLGIEVVAEGVETTEQWRVLRDLGCQRMQGYLFSRPVAGEHATRMVATVREVLDALAAADHCRAPRRPAARRRTIA